MNEPTPSGEEAADGAQASEEITILTTSDSVNQSGEPGDAPDDSFLGTLLYGLSVPERATRSLTALVGGLVGETAARIIPLSFRSSRSYQTFIGQSLDMLIHDVGGVAKKTTPTESAESSPVSGDQPSGDQVDGDQPSQEMQVSLARKAVGGMLDIAGTATMHLSPLTVLAIFNDVAYGSNTYLKTLAEELRQEGIIDEQSTINHASDFLEALSKTSTAAGSAVEAPPLDIAGLKQTIDEIREGVASADPTTLIPQSEIKQIWGDIEKIASASEMGMFQVGTTMTMHAMNRVNLATRGTLTSIRVAGNLFDAHIIDHYEQAISDIYQDGLYETVAVSSRPYVTAVWDNFDEERSTWTEDILSGKLLGDAWDGMKSWFK